MSVTYDNEAMAVIKLLKDFDDFNEDVIDNIVDRLVGDDAGSLLMKRFERKVKGQRTYEKLKPATIKRKAKLKQKYIMKASGDLKSAVKKTAKGKVKGRKVEITASVPIYGKVHQDGQGKMPKREFFSFNGKNGRPQSADVNTFNKVAEMEYDKQLSKLGIKN